MRAAVVLVLLALDRATKVWAMKELAPRGTIPLVPFFDLTYVENTGAAFGLGRGSNGFFVVVAVVLVAGLLWMRRSWPKNDPWLQWGSLLVVCGAAGNLYDRLAYSFVVDFFHLHHWPVFNVADSCISVGAGMLAWGMRDEKALAAKKS